MSANKQYGLILPKKNATDIKRAAIFNDSDSDDPPEDVSKSDWIKKSYQRQVAAQSSNSRGGTRLNSDLQKALQQDPTVCQYDEVYDDLQKKKSDEVKEKTEEKRKPRYIQSLLKKAQQRKVENERRIERQVQKEREAEGEQFKDKETFVTSSYKKKLEEFAKLDEEERRQDMLEDICDVSKQQDLGGFYRHLYKTVVDKKNNDPGIKVEVKKEEEDKPKKKRQYRKRKSSESDSVEEDERNLETSESSSSSSDSSNGENDAKVEKCKENKKKKMKEDEPSEPKQEDGTEIENKEADQKEAEKESIPVKENVKEKPKINIWEKRTVGPVFDAALKRYFERKAQRLTARNVL